MAIGAYPPWNYTLDYESAHREKPAGYFWIFSSPKPESTAPAYGIRVDLTRLSVQWLVLVVGVGGSVVLTTLPRRD